MSRLRVLSFIALLILVSRCGQTQDFDSPTRTYRGAIPNQEIRVSDLPLRTAASTDPNDTLAAALETIFHDPQVCCGRRSALENAVLSARPLSLPSVSSKLQGKYLLDDGRRIVITAEYIPAIPVGYTVGDRVMASLRDDRPLIMEWNSELYVVYGALFDVLLYDDGSRVDAIAKLLLFDPRFSDTRREISFDRVKDDWGKVQGVLALKVMPQ